MKVQSANKTWRAFISSFTKYDCPVSLIEATLKNMGNYSARIHWELGPFYNTG